MSDSFRPIRGDSLEDENVQQPSPCPSRTAQANAIPGLYERHSINYGTTTFVMPHPPSDDWVFLGNEIPWPDVTKTANQQVPTAYEHLMEGSVVDQSQQHQVASDTGDSNLVRVSPSMLAPGSASYNFFDIQPQARHSSLLEPIDVPPASIGPLHAAILSDDDFAQVSLERGDEVQQNAIATVLRTEDTEGYIITCLDPLCGAKTFARFQEFTRHDKSFHRHIGPEIWCPVKHCERSNALGHKGFPSIRKDKLREHVRLIHGFELAD